MKNVMVVRTILKRLIFLNTTLEKKLVKRMINFLFGFGVDSILSVFCLCLLQASSKLDEMEEKFREEPENEQN